MSVSVSRICHRFGITRQAYYKQSTRQKMKNRQGEIVNQLVQDIRHQLPRVGGKKLFSMIKGNLGKEGIKMGRDLFFDHLRSTGQLIRPRRRYMVTTRSSHRFRTYNNLLEGKLLSGPNQAWVSDITYLRTHQGFCYLSLITDAWSRKILGYEVSNSLELEGCLKALRMAFKQLPGKHQLIHHSDRGIQYCSNVYTNLLKSRGVKISMAEKGNCYQNALAERVNGILKDEFYLNNRFRDPGHARSTAKQSIWLYNCLRPHWSLELKTPDLMHKFIPENQCLT